MNTKLLVIPLVKQTTKDAQICFGLMYPNFSYLKKRFECWLVNQIIQFHAFFDQLSQAANNSVGKVRQRMKKS